MTLDTILLKDGKAVEIDKFISYSTDNKMFAVYNSDLYINRGNYYELLKKGFYDTNKRKTF
jgi:hypothetical protein